MDYLDDVSGKYYDQTAIRDQGEVAAYFANPSVADPLNGRVIGEPGSIRGNPNYNDNYFLFEFKLHFTVNRNGYNNTTSCLYNNGWIKPNGSTPKIKKTGRRRKIRLFR